MSKSITAVEARQKLGELLNRVALRNEEFVIERAGKPLAKISPLDSNRNQSKARLDFRKAAGLGAEVWKDVQADAYIKQERDAWD